jgi:hypothetical protein
VDAWLADARDALAEAAGAPSERTNAPLLCYLVGRAQWDADLGELAAAVRRSTS